MSLRGSRGRATSLGYLAGLRNGSQVDGVYGTEEVDITDTGLVFATKVNVGGKEYELVVDTGSADTWLPKKNFQCSQVQTGDFLPRDRCGLADTYTQSSTFRPVNNQNFHIEYNDGEELTGTFGIETVEVAGITVKNQQIGLVDNAAWIGDTATSGTLGLAFPAATKAFSGTNPIYNSLATQKIYNPIFTNMYTKGFVAPLFSIALDRNLGGQLAIGGLPPVSYFPIFASSPFQLLTTASSAVEDTSSTSAYTLYTITTGGFDYSNSSASEWSYSNFPNPFGQPSDRTQVQVIVDTATIATYVPQGTADAVNAQFDPPAFYRDDTTGFYRIDCKATPPKFGVKIGFETFYINPLDMIVEMKGYCVSGVAAAGPNGSSILGHSFLTNVLAVFDVGAQMMRFAAREYY